MSKKVGFVVSATKTTWKKYIDAFEHELGKGWTIDHTGTGVGVNVVFIDYEPKVDANGNPIDGAAGDAGLIQQTAAQFANPANKFDVIVTAGELAATACENATQTIPIVVASAGDLTGLAGGNLTGFTNGQNDDPKHQILSDRIDLMLQKLPPQKSVAVVGNDTVEPVRMAMMYAVGRLQQNNIPVYPASFTQASDFQNIQVKLKPPAGTPIADILLVCSDPLMRTNGTNFVSTVRQMQMKTMCEFAEWHTEHNGDLCYGVDFPTLFQNAARYVDQILRNTPLVNLPITPADPKASKQTPSTYP